MGIIIEWIKQNISFFYEDVILPSSSYDLSAAFIKVSISFNYIVDEVALKCLSVAQFYQAFPVFWIFLQLALVIYPPISQISKVVVIKTTQYFFRFIIIDLADSLKLIINKLALICNISILIVKSAISMHSIVFPLPNIIPSILEF